MVDFGKFAKTQEEIPKQKRQSRYEQLSNAIEDSNLLEKHKEELSGYIPILLGKSRLSYKGFSTMLAEFHRVIPDELKTQRILTATTNEYRNLVFASDYESIDTTKLNKDVKPTTKKELKLSDEVF